MGENTIHRRQLYPYLHVFIRFPDDWVVSDRDKMYGEGSLAHGRSVDVGLFFGSHYGQIV